MDKSTKLYVKAINYYNDGCIDKALEFCEKSISENLSNSSAINLKGLLYYLKGDLDNAQALWKMNYQVNKDVISKKYFEDSKKDGEKDKLYKEAVKCIKEIKIKEALEKLQVCRESDFNSINVKNSIVLCYIKIGEYKKAEKLIDEILKTDRKNKTALALRKELIKFGIIKNKASRKYFIIAGALSILLIISIAFLKSLKEFQDYDKSKAVIENNLSSKVQEVGDNENSQDKKEEIKEEPVKTFSAEEAKKALEDKDYEKIYAIASSFKDMNILDEDRKLIKKLEKTLKSDGISYFYSKGRKALNAKDYTKAFDNLIKAYEYGSESYLYSHIIYMLGFAYEQSGDIEKAIMYYEQYDNRYPRGNYEQTVLYELALIYKNIDDETSKKYADKLTKSFPKSVYNNSVIKGILTR